ncbi:MAG: hypothetical protein MK041_01280 [Aquabacterium sp.]|nr:hypothetical protein [Aquabacterium sp.]
MNFPFYFADPARCPDVMRVVVCGTARAPTVQRTLFRAQGEADHTFARRAQAVAYAMWLQHGGARSVHIECCYGLPNDPELVRDEWANTRRELLHAMQDEDADGMARVQAAMSLAQMTGLLPVVKH